jgi:hypothetical protein
VDGRGATLREMQPDEDATSIFKVDFLRSVWPALEGRVDEGRRFHVKVGFFLPSSTLGTFIYLLAVRSISEGRFSFDSNPLSVHVASVVSRE